MTPHIQTASPSALETMFHKVNSNRYLFEQIYCIETGVAYFVINTKKYKNITNFGLIKVL